MDNKNPLEILQAVAFGRSATPEGQQYYRNFQPVEPESQEQKNEAKMRSLPRLIDYSYGEDEDRVSGSVMLSGKEQKAYQEKFLELLPDNMEDLSEEDQKAIYQYAEQTARDSVLADRGIEGYEPASWVQKAKEAVREGVSIENYLKIRDEFKEIEPEKDENGKTTETAANQKREYLRKDKNLTAEQKQAIDLLLISGGMNPRFRTIQMTMPTAAPRWIKPIRPGTMQRRSCMVSMHDGMKRWPDLQKKRSPERKPVLKRSSRCCSL